MKLNLFSKMAGLAVAAILAGLIANTPAFSKEILSRYEVSNATAALVKDLATHFEVQGRKGEALRVLVTQEKTAEFLQLAPQARLIEGDINAYLKQRVNHKKGTIAGYHSFAEVEQFLKSVVQNYPQIAKLEIYGQSTQGKPLYALKLSDNVNLDEFEPRLMITAATHGDELITVEVLIGLINQLLAGYPNDTRLANFIDQRELYFIPVVNPDGFVRQERYDNGVDPNRQYPWPESPNRQPVASIAAIMKFYNQHNFSGSIDIHASGGMIMFPWAYTYDSIPADDHRRFSVLAANMAENNNYANGPISEVIYIAPGSSADYYYWQNKGAAFAYEIGDSAAPSANRIPAITQEVTESTWRFMEAFE